MEREQKRIFLIAAKGNYHNPDGVYFTKFLSDADEVWIPENDREARKSSYVLTARCMGIPIQTYRLEDGKPTIRPKRERTEEQAYER